MEKVKVSREIADALDKQSKDEWSQQFNLISHCKGYSGNGILCGSIYTEEFEVLRNLQPLEFAKCLIVGYEVTEEYPNNTLEQNNFWADVNYLMEKKGLSKDDAIAQITMDNFYAEHSPKNSDFL